MNINSVFLFSFYGLIFFCIFLKPAVTWQTSLKFSKATPRAGDPCLATPSTGDEKECIARAYKYDESVYRHVTGCYCFFYTNSVLFVEGINIRFRYCSKSSASNETIYYPCFGLVGETSNLEFDYRNSQSVEVIGKNLKTTKAKDDWIACSKAAIDCCNKMDDTSVNPGSDYCPATWDAWSCFDKAPSNTVQHQPCPDYIYSSSPPSCQQYSDKDCLGNGTWNITTSYQPCTSHYITMLKTRITYQVSVLGVSIVMSLPALIIFFAYSKLRITRISLHRNLILAILVRNVFNIVTKISIILDALNSSEKAAVMEENFVWCRIVSVLQAMSVSAAYSCMLLEGIFLHRIIAAAFKGEPKMFYYYIVAAIIAIVPVAVWSAMYAVYNDKNCWAIDDDTSFSYILDGPRIVTLVINFLLMLDIVRVLCTKLKRINTAKAGHVRRMTRATILLIPLFGIQFIVTLVPPATKECTLEELYYYTFYTIDGLQGAVVALLYCYLNKEVHMQLIRTYNVVMTRIYRLFGKDYIPKHRPTWHYSEHRHTATSLVTLEDLARVSVSGPRDSNISIGFNNTGRLPRTSITGRSSVIVGTVSDILSHKDGSSPRVRNKRPSYLFPKSSVKRDGLLNFSSKIPNAEDGTRQRKVSAVAEEMIDEHIDQKPMPVERHTKLHDSDEEIVVTPSSDENSFINSNNPFISDFSEEIFSSLKFPVMQVQQLENESESNSISSDINIPQNSDSSLGQSCFVENNKTSGLENEVDAYMSNWKTFELPDDINELSVNIDNSEKMNRLARDNLGFSFSSEDVTEKRHSITIRHRTNSDISSNDEETNA